MRKLSGHGFDVDLPQGWDGRIYTRRDETSDTTNRALHAATFALPSDPGDFGAGAVDQMTDSDVLVVLLEYGREAAGTALFANDGLPSSLRPESFSPNGMPKVVPGRSASQYFFTLDERAFCLFVVLGSHNDRVRLAGVASAVASAITIAP